MVFLVAVFAEAGRLPFDLPEAEQVLVRWSWPRFRFDQLMSLAWKVMLPLGLVNLLAVAILEELQHPEMLGTFGNWTMLQTFEDTL